MVQAILWNTAVSYGMWSVVQSYSPFWVYQLSHSVNQHVDMSSSFAAFNSSHACSFGGKSCQNFGYRRNREDLSFVESYLGTY